MITDSAQTHRPPERLDSRKIHEEEPLGEVSQKTSSLVHSEPACHSFKFGGEGPQVTDLMITSV